LLLSIPFALGWTFGKMAKDRKQGYAVLGAMGGLFLIGALLVMPFEANGNIHITRPNVSQAITATSPGAHGGQGDNATDPSSPPSSLLVDQYLDRVHQLGQ